MSLAAFILSLFAAAFSIWNVLTGRRIATETEKRTLFLRLHEGLIAEDLARGRRIAFRLQSVDEARDLIQSASDDYHLANRALAMLDVLALFAEQDYVDKQLVLSEWRAQLARVHTNARFLIEARAAEHGVAPWPHLRSLAAEAAGDT